MQKVIDREVSHVNTTLSDVTVATDKNCQNDVATSLDVLIQKLISLKKKARLKYGIGR